MTMWKEGGLASRPAIGRQGDQWVAGAGSLRTFAVAGPRPCTRVDLNDCLDQALDTAEDEMGRELRVQKAYGVLPPVLCRPQELGRVFCYLLLKAVQGDAILRLIRLGTRRQGDRVQVQFATSGKGCPVEDRKKILEPLLHRGGVGGGAGLRMNSGYEIIKQHGGDIWVASEVGKGTTFIISLPIDGERDADV